MVVPLFCSTTSMYQSILPMLGYQTIDFVLAAENDGNEDFNQKRDIYFTNIRKRGLVVEEPVPSRSGTILFWKITAPLEVLYDIAEEVNELLPTTKNDVSYNRFGFDYIKQFKTWWKQFNPFLVEESLFEERQKFFAARFNKRRISDFHNFSEPEKLFPPSLRSRLVAYVLENTPFSHCKNSLGISHLKTLGVFTDGYPCHDAHEEKDNSGGSAAEKKTKRKNSLHVLNLRQKLSIEWASFKNLNKYQPIEAIKEYFGIKIAFYFTWIGFYTMWLIPATIVGILCIFYGMLSILNDEPLNETCRPRDNQDYIMCPLCDKYCSYYSLKDFGCTYATITHIFDNNITPFFAVFMSFWSVIYLEMWKREEAKYMYNWHISDEVHEENVRPKYSIAATIKKRNPVTGKLEPSLPQFRYFLKKTSTFSVVFFFILMVVASVVGVMCYRAAMFSVKFVHGRTFGNGSYSKFFITITSATLNLIFINIMKIGYKRLAFSMTEWENPRTQSAFEDSFVIKLFGFEFCNMYASLFYVAFFKNEIFTGWPGKYTRIGQHRLEGCSDQGCFLELCIQMVVIMGGQQFLGNIVEIGWPYIKRKYYTWKHNLNQTSFPVPRWESDFQLSEQDSLSLVWEYQEVVIQYGFVTLFVAAFPLAPFIALCTNIVEIRIDAINLINSFRRPVASKSQGIGIWYEILATMTALSVLVNGFVLSFSSEFIPRQVYKYQFSEDGSMKGYVNWTLSIFNVSDFSANERPMNNDQYSNLTQCRFPGYHDSGGEYLYSTTHWKILSFRLLFAFVFHWMVTASTRVISWIIPDQPKSVSLSIRRQEYMTRKAIQKSNVKIRDLNLSFSDEEKEVEKSEVV